MSIIASAPVPAANRLIDADTTDLTAIRRTGATEGRFPVNQPYAGRADDLALVQEALRTNPEGVRELADAIRRSGGLDFQEGYAHGYADALGRVFANRTAECPTYCSDDHRGQVTEVDGFTIGLVHERILTELTAKDPSWTDRAATAVVRVESCTEAGRITTPTRVVLTVAEGDEGSYGGEDTQGWSGTPEQSEALGYALIAAARINRAAR